MTKKLLYEIVIQHFHSFQIKLFVKTGRSRDRKSTGKFIMSE